MTRPQFTRYCRKCDRHLSTDDFDVFVQQTGLRAGRNARHSYCRECRADHARGREGRRVFPSNTTVYCGCGCGKLTSVARRTDTARGFVRGEPVGYIKGHSAPPPGPSFVPCPQTGCWIWQRSKNGNGYGTCAAGLAHRVLYEQHRGPVPKGVDLHHACKTRDCVNPDHLEPIPHAEHMRRTRMEEGKRHG